MKKILGIVFIMVTLNPIKAQIAMDFNMSDCSGNMHHLFTDYLDSEEVVIIEFFMTCSSCIEVGQKITPMYNQLVIDYPGKVHFFAFNFLDDLDCSVATNFVTTNSINAIPFDSGATQLAYYGGFGMPSVVIVGGSQHEVVYFSKTPMGTNDTASMDNAIRDFFTTIGIENIEQMDYQLYPNPAANHVNIQFPQPYLNSSLTITTITGQVLFNQKILGLSQQIETSSFPSGTYFINIRSPQINSTKKIIINR